MSIRNNIIEIAPIEVHILSNMWAISLTMVAKCSSAWFKKHFRVVLNETCHTSFHMRYELVIEKPRFLLTVIPIILGLNSFHLVILNYFLKHCSVDRLNVCVVLYFPNNTIVVVCICQTTQF